MFAGELGLAEQVRAAHPGWWSAWQAGVVRPYVLYEVRANAGYSLEDAAVRFKRLALPLDASLRGEEEAEFQDDVAGLVERIEEGLLYPSWRQLCCLAAVYDVTVERLLNPVGLPLPYPLVHGTDARIRAALRARYHPALVAHSVEGTGPDGAVRDTVASPAAPHVVTRTAVISAGTQLAAGVTIEDVIADIDAGLVPELRILRARYREELDTFHRALSLGTATSGGAKTAEGLPAGFDTRYAWHDAQLSLTISGSIATGREHGRPMLLISIAAHHAEHGRVPLPHGEAALWVPILFGDLDAPNVQRLGTLTGITDSPDPAPIATTEYFEVQLEPVVGRYSGVVQSSAGRPASHERNT